MSTDVNGFVEAGLVRTVAMSADNAFLLAICLLVGAYLLYALLRAEDF